MQFLLKSSLIFVLIFVFFASIVAAEKIDLNTILPPPQDVTSWVFYKCFPTVTKGNFADHLRRSNTPGIDIDYPVSCIESEKDRFDLGPEASPWTTFGKYSVYSPVTGKIINPGPGNFGTVEVCDIKENECNHYHRLLHGHKFLSPNELLIFDERFSNFYLGNDLVLNGKIEKGDFIFYLGGSAPPFESTYPDHVHYAIYKMAPGPDGQNTKFFLNPENISVDQTGTVIDSDDYDYFFLCENTVDNNVAKIITQECETKLKVTGKISHRYNTTKFINGSNVAEFSCEAKKRNLFFRKNEISSINWHSGNSKGPVSWDDDEIWSFESNDVSSNQEITITATSHKETYNYRFSVCETPSVEVMPPTKLKRE